MPLILPNDITNNTLADAAEVQSNFDAIELWANHDPVLKTGGTMTGALNLSGMPTANEQAANKQYVDTSIGNSAPTGVVNQFAATIAPAGWLLCDGTAVSRTTFAALFAVIGTTYGAGNGTTTFNVPNLQGRVPIGYNSADPLFNGLNKPGGTKDTALPSHSHTGPSHSHPIDHDHGVAGTSTADLTHQHSIDHDHPNVTTDTQGSHQHRVEGVDFLYAQFGTGTRGFGSDAVGRPGNLSSAFVGFAGDHAHNVDLPPYSGLSGANASNPHAHTVDLPNFTGSSGAAGTGATSTVGVAATNQNLPPYVVLQYIIKA